MKTMVELSQDFLKPVLHKQAVCIDATLGNGKDTRFFLKRGVKKVYSFEIQEDLCQKARQEIMDDRAVIVCKSHSQMKEEVLEEQVDGIIFNFGYCPKKNHQITTLPDTSLSAVQQALDLLKVKGRMSLVFYNHAKADEERSKVQNYLEHLDPHEIAVQKIVQLNAKNAPFLLCVEKKKEKKSKSSNSEA